jgi:hypothetical protein
MHMHRDISAILRLTLALIVTFAGLCTLTAGARADTVAANNPCSLLTAAEVEAVLGEPLAGLPYRANATVPSATGDTCRYEAASFRAINLRVDWSGGAQAFGLIGAVSGAADAAGLKGVLTLSDGTKLSGAWDQAGVFMCCEFNALHGDERVVVDIGSSKATVEAAAALADKAVQRLDHPIEIDSNSGIVEATARDKTRPGIASACALVTRAEAEALVGTALVSEPQGAEDGCTYAWKSDGSDDQEQISLAVTWRDGFGEMRRTLAAIGQGLDMLANEGLDLTQSAGPKDKVFDEYSASIIGVMAVRKDVMMSIESGPMSDLAAKFIAVAAGKL